MLDINMVRKQPELVEANIKRRGMADRLEDLRNLIKWDNERRALIGKADELRAKRNAITKEIAELKAKGKPATAKMKEVKEIPEQIKDIEERLVGLNDRCMQLLLRLPNIIDESVPVGKDEGENVEIRTWGKKPEFKFQPKGHEELALGLNGIDLERAAKISGARFYFLKGDLVILQNAVLRFALDLLVKRGFTPILPPFMMKRKPYEGVIDIGDFETVMYKIEKDEMHLIATSEHPLVAMHSDETFESKDLPLKYAGISSCFRTEAGAHGKDTKGIFRVHQFDKVEQIVFCKPDDSWKHFEDLQKNGEELLQKLEIPYRVVNICTGDLGVLKAKSYDTDGWFPVQGKYRELQSCSNVTDFQARRLNIKWREKEGTPPLGNVHTINNTAAASPRILACILENNQQEDGSIKVPKVLWGYTGLKEVSPKK
jgi:seryl-tRNA synthetase